MAEKMITLQNMGDGPCKFFLLAVSPEAPKGDEPKRPFMLTNQPEGDQRLAVWRLHDEPTAGERTLRTYANTPYKFWFLTLDEKHEIAVLSSNQGGEPLWDRWQVEPADDRHKEIVYVRNFVAFDREFYLGVDTGSGDVDCVLSVQGGNLGKRHLWKMIVVED